MSTLLRSTTVSKGIWNGFSVSHKDHVDFGTDHTLPLESQKTVLSFNLTSSATLFSSSAISTTSFPVNDSSWEIFLRVEQYHRFSRRLKVVEMKQLVSMPLKKLQETIQSSIPSISQVMRYFGKHIPVSLPSWNPFQMYHSFSRHNLRLKQSSSEVPL